MLAKVLSSAVLGIDAYRVEVEVDISSGLPAFATGGLPEAAVKESRERVKSAISNSGYRFPDDRITVKELLKAGGEVKDVTEADIIVAGGRAFKNQDNFKMLYDLAKVLDAAVGRFDL